MVFNKHFRIKKRLNLILNNFCASILTSVVLIDKIDSSNGNDPTISNFYIAFIFLQVIDFSFHLAYFSTDFFEDAISFLFKCLGIFCFWKSQDDEEDDEYEEAEAAKFDLIPLTPHLIAFRKIPLTIKSFFLFITNNIILSLSFYHSLLDLSLRLLLFGISLNKTAFLISHIYYLVIKYNKSIYNYFNSLL